MNRTLPSSSGLLEVLPIYQPRLIILGVNILSQLREIDLPVGDANRTLPSSSGLLEVLPILPRLVFILGVKELSQLRESDLPVGDASRTLSSSNGLLELLPIYQPSVDYIGSNGFELEFKSLSMTVFNLLLIHI